jgi:soluble lytic murein transglycosylase-like protein
MSVRADDATPAPAEPQDNPQAEPSASPASLPQSICEVLAAAAAANDLPAEFFTRLIWQESRFRPEAVSHAGAQGVAQFIASPQSREKRHLPQVSRSLQTVSLH